MIEHTGEAGDEKGVTLAMQDPGGVAAGIDQDTPALRSNEHGGSKEAHVPEQGTFVSLMKDA